MTRVLMRAHKDTFEVVSPEVSLQRNKLGGNSGNLLFSAAVHRMLHTAGTDVVAGQGRPDPAEADRINAEFDVFVVPLANAFRLEFEGQLRRLTKLIEQLTIPVVVFGVGAQSGLDYDLAEMRPIERSVKAFAAAVLDRSASIGVRGEFTLDYLQRLGFHDVEVIGCPSVFLHGSDFRVDKKVAALDRQSKVSINVSPYVAEIGDVVRRHHAAYPNLRYIAQDSASLSVMLWGYPTDSTGEGSETSVHTTRPLYGENKVRYFADPWPWLSYLGDFDFAFGTRIHGNIAALLAGTPSVVLAHDSRTLELSRYHNIPYRKITEVAGVDAADLYAEADFDPMNKSYAERLDSMTAFLDRNGVDHVFAHEGSTTAFDERLRDAVFPPAIRPVTSADTPELVRRLRYLRDRDAELARRGNHLERKVKALERTRDRQARQLVRTVARVGRLEKQLGGVQTSRRLRLRRAVAASPAGRRVAPLVRRLRRVLRRG